MGIRPNRRRNNSRYNNNRRGPDNNRVSNRPSKNEEKLVDTGKICCLCEKSIRELHSAIAHGENHEPVHFDCILNSIAQSEPMEPNERVCYLGNGNFGIITIRNSSSTIRFLIKKRFKYETEIPAWRKEMAVKLDEVSSFF